MKKTILSTVLVLFAYHAAAAQPAEGVPRTILPLGLLREIISEASGDLAFQNETLIAGVNRNRLPEEYVQGYFETGFVLSKLKEYGIKSCQIIDLPTRGATTWDAEMAELWITKPEKRKIADLKEVAACLCQGSATADVTAELVYVGPGNKKEYYEGKDVKGKIALVNGPPGMAQMMAVEQLGALGVIGYSSSHPEYDPDEVGWSSIRASDTLQKTFGFMISARQGNDLRDALERGAKIEVRAVAKAQMVPYKEQMVEALIPGTDYPNEELVFTAHLFEGFAKQGANDNISGCVAILETARVLQKVMDEGKIPPLKRSVRFLFVPEISGTQAYIRMYPEITKRFFANINEDMVGEGLIKNVSMFELVQAPWYLGSFLNDVMRALYEWVGTTQRNNERTEAYLPIWSPTGSRDPFYYVIDPYSGGSDHVVFADGGVRVPACMLIVWPDQWYHTNRDTIDKSDPTQLKRVAFIGAAAAVAMAGAGPDETLAILNEVSRGGLGRIGEAKERAENMILAADPPKLHEAYRDADNVLGQGIAREQDNLASVRFLARGDAGLEALIAADIRALGEARPGCGRALEQLYRNRCRKEGLTPVKLAPTADEARAARIVAVRTEKMRGPFDVQGFAAARKDLKDAPAYSLGRSESAVRNYLDGTRSVLDIRNAMAAETGAAPALKDIENYVRTLEMAGFVTIRK